MNPSPPPLFATLRSLPAAVWILFAATFINRFGTFVVPFLVLYLTRRGFTNTEAGLALSAYGGGHLVASILGGQLADSFGRRKTILLSMGASAVTMLLFSQAATFWTVLPLAFLAGLATEIYRPASSALLTDLVEPGQRVPAFAGYRLAINAGWAIGPAVGGWMAKHSYFWLFVGDAATSLIFGVIAWFGLPAGLRLSKAQQVNWRQAVQVIRADHRFLQVLVASLMVGMIFMQMNTTFGMEVLRHGHSEAVFGSLLSLNGVLIILLELPLTAWTRRLPTVPVMAAGYFLCGLGFGLNALGGTLPVFALSMIVFTFGEMISLPVASAYVANLAPTELRGRYMGANGLTWALALIIGPGAGMALFAWRPNALWLGSVLCGALAAGILLRGNRAIRPVNAPAAA